MMLGWRGHRVRTLLAMLGLEGCTVARGLVDELPPPGFSVLDIGCPLRPECPVPDDTGFYPLGGGVADLPGYLFDAGALSLLPYCGLGPDGPCPQVPLEDVVAPGAEARAGVLHIGTDGPQEVWLRRATLTDLTVELVGPVELRISHGATLQRVDIRSLDADPEVQVTIEDSQLSQVSIEINGRLSIDRSPVTQARLRASESSLTSVELSYVDLETQQLNASATKISQGSLALESATLTLSELNLVHVTKCGKMSLLASQVVDSRVSACAAGGLHVESSRVGVSDMDGPIASRASAWSQVRFGTETYTSVAAVGTSITDSTLCPSLAELQLGTGNTLACVVCPALKQGVTACLMPQPEHETQIVQSSCAVLAQPPACTGAADSGVFGIPDAGLALLDAGAPVD